MSVKNQAALTFPLATYPGINRFAIDLVSNQGRAAHFVHRCDLSTLAPPREARDRDTIARELAVTNRAWGHDVAPLLSQWLAGESVTLVAGQQVGFAGGPLYTFAKIASLLHLGERLRERGVQSTIFFWMATEDHDFDEVAAFALGDPRGVRRFRPSERPTTRRAVGSLSLPASMVEALSSSLDDLQENWLSSGMTFRDSFAHLLADVFPGRIVLVDSLLPALRQLGKGLFQKVAAEIGEAERMLDRRSDELTEAGYVPQITRRSGEHYPLFFHIDKGGVRSPLQRNEGTWSAAGREISDEELQSEIESSPETISTGAALRPLLQDLVFKPDVFVGGPAEVAYYAQLGLLYDRFEVRQPHVALRGHALVARAKQLKAFDRYELSRDDIFHSAEEAIDRLDPEPLEKIDSVGRHAAETLEEQITQIEKLALPADKSLEHSIRRSRRHLKYHLERMVERARDAARRRDRERYAALLKFHREMMPGGVPQDRVILWLPFWLEFGTELVQRMIEEIRPDSDTGVVLGL